MLGDDGDVGGRDRAPGLDEGAGDRLLVNPRDEVVELLLGVEVVAQVLDGRMSLGRDEAADVDHHLEIGIGLGRRDRELRELVCVHVMSS